MLNRLVDFVAVRIKCPRFWEEGEWKRLTSKERVWIWYKSHWMLMGIGNAEMDNVMPFITGEFIQQIAIVSVFIYTFGFPEWTYVLYPFFYLGLKYCHWLVGNSIDRADLVAWNKEIDNRRDRFVREVRKRAMEEPFRKNL